MVPFTSTVPATAGAPVSGWPLPTETEYLPSGMIGSPASETMLKSRWFKSNCTFCDWPGRGARAGIRAKRESVRPATFGKPEIELGHLVAGEFASVGHGDFSGHRLAGGDRAVGSARSLYEKVV